MVTVVSTQAELHDDEGSPVERVGEVHECDSPIYSICFRGKRDQITIFCDKVHNL